MRKYGWKKNPDGLVLPKYSESKFFKVMELPSSVDLRSSDSPILDQGQLGSCTANGIGGCINFIQRGFMASRLFIYFNERLSEGTIGDDAGANIADGITSVQTQGVCDESIWPYDISQFTTPPPASAYEVALKDIVTDYLSCSTVLEIKNCLASGFPVVFGMTVFASFESEETASTGVVPMPAEGEEQLGGHCMKIVGYDDANARVIVANSWGTGWGDKGYCYIPYAFIDAYASDFGTIRRDTGE
jgi:C1A family cysteine protease